MLLALAACSPADAQPPSGVKPPAGWQAMPAVAQAAKDALGKSKVDAVEAHGQPAMGCTMLWMIVPGTEANQVLASLGTLDITDVVKPSGETGILSFRFKSKVVEGRMRARLANGKTTALACWWNEREPRACETACTTVIGAMP